MTELHDAWVQKLPEAFKRKARLELDEYPETRILALKELKHLVNDEDGFEPLMTDAFLLRFLRAKKYDVKRAHKTLKNYYAYKLRYSGLLTDFNPSDLTHILEKNCVFVSPKRCTEGCGIIIIMAGQFDVETFGPEKLISAVITSAEVGIETEGSQVCGSQIVIDMQGMSLSKMKYYSSPVLLSRIFRGLQDCWPYRITAIHGCHEPSYYTFVYNIVKPMLSKKLKERVHFHGENMESLHRFIPPEALPKALGGTLGEKDFADFRSVIHANEHIMENINKYEFQGVKSPRYDSCKATGEHNLVIPKELQTGS